MANAQRRFPAEPVRGSPAWRKDVEAWIASALAGEDIAVVDELREHLSQPWSSIWTVMTDHGRFWFKENGPSQQAERMVHATLAALAPDYVDAPVAVDQHRPWMLTRDGGLIAETRVQEPRGVPPAILVDLVQDYARLQRLTIDQLEPLKRAGLGVLHPRDAARLARGQAEYLGGLDRHDSRHMTEERYQSIIAALPALEEAGQALAAGPVPLMLDQGDLLPTNVFLPRDGGHFRVFDFADAVWTHPFCSLVMLAKDYLRRLPRPQPDESFDLRAERIRVVVDGYLEEWLDFAPMPVLRELACHAIRIGPLLRSSAWLQAFESCDPTELTRHGDGAWWWLQRLTKPVLV